MALSELEKSIYASSTITKPENADAISFIAFKG